MWTLSLICWQLKRNTSILKLTYKGNPSAFLHISGPGTQYFINCYCWIPHTCIPGKSIKFKLSVTLRSKTVYLELKKERSLPVEPYLSGLILTDGKAGWETPLKYPYHPNKGSSLITHYFTSCCHLIKYYMLFCSRPSVQSWDRTRFLSVYKH